MTSKYNFNLEAVEILDDKYWAILNENPSGVYEDSRKVSVARLRLLAGYVCMKSHLYRTGIADCLDYTLCDSGPHMAIEHLDM
ncbi:hypothetical protein TNCV_744661 [Trichonephila clavipes]|nr:hypothetical protein TNCV_744661 [Trichonephila clavipes]